MTGSMTVFNVIKPKAGSSMAIYGLGAVGCAALMAANVRNEAGRLAIRTLNIICGLQLRGLGNLIAIDVLPSRLQLAVELGATHTIDPRSENVTERILEITSGKGVDSVVEATGVIKGSHAVDNQPVHFAHSFHFQTLPSSPRGRL